MEAGCLRDSHPAGCCPIDSARYGPCQAPQSKKGLPRPYMFKAVADGAQPRGASAKASNPAGGRRTTGLKRVDQQQ